MSHRTSWWTSVAGVEHECESSHDCQSHKDQKHTRVHRPSTHCLTWLGTLRLLFSHSVSVGLPDSVRSSATGYCSVASRRLPVVLPARGLLPLLCVILVREEESVCETTSSRFRRAYDSRRHAGSATETKHQ